MRVQYYGNSPQILFSIFNDNNPNQHLLISFFHQLMHILYKQQKCSRLELQLNTTLDAIKFARNNYKIQFSNEAISWLINQNMQYNKKQYNYAQLKLKSDEQYEVFCEYLS